MKSAHRLFLASGSLAFLCALGAARPAPAAIDQWSQIGPFGGQVTAVAVHPVATDVAYAATLGNGVFKSSDGGASWTPVNQGLGSRAIYALALDPVEPQRLYAGAGSGGLHRSTDSGASWSVVLPAFVYQVVVAPSRPQTVYAVDGANRIHRSDDGGGSWREIPNPAPSALTDFLTVDSRSPDTLYLGVAGYPTPAPDIRGLYRTTDAGASWTLLVTGLHETDPGTLRFAIAQAPDRPDTLYAAIVLDDTGQTVTDSSTLAKSTDGGTTWALLDAPGGLPLLALAHGRVVTDRAVSTDGGATWTPSTPPTTRVTSLAASPLAPERVLLGTAYSGAFRSLDGGSTFSASSRGMTATWIESLAVAADSTLYAGTVGGLFTGHAATLEWAPLSPPGGTPGDDFLEIPLLAIHPRRPRLLYAAVPGAARETLVRTDDGGATWTALDRPGDGLRVGDVALDPSAPGTVYASNDFNASAGSCRSSRSPDFGAHWTCLPVGLTPRLEVDPIDPRNVYALGSRISKSTDRGATWTVDGYSRGLPKFLAPTSLVHAAASGHLYLADTQGRIFRTTDGGRNWKLGQGNLPRGGFVSLAVDPHNPAVIYAAVSFRGVYRSKNGGQRWEWLNRGLSGDLISSPRSSNIPLAVDPRDPATLYVGTNSRGVFTITLTN